MTKITVEKYPNPESMVNVLSPLTIATLAYDFANRNDLLESQLTAANALVDRLRPVNQEYTIGEFTLSEFPEQPDSLWIHHESREGAAFDIKELEKVIRKFYNDNF